MVKNKSFLISFEGPEGGGKSLQAQRLGLELVKLGLQVCLYHEPGGTWASDLIKEDIFMFEKLAVETELLAFNACRASLVAERIIPDLRVGDVVILDRFIDSSCVYQGILGKLDRGHVEDVIRFATQDLREPDLTFLLDIDPKIGLRRKLEQGQWNKIESRSISYHTKVRRGFLRLADADKTGRWEVIDASRLEDEVFENILRITEAKLIDHGIIEGGIRRERGI